MEVVPLESADTVGPLAADTIEALVRRRPTAVLGLATGSSPLPTCRELVRRHRDGTGPSYDEVRCFTLDEYVGLPPGHPQSYRETIVAELTDGLGISRDGSRGPTRHPPRCRRPGSSTRLPSRLLAASTCECSASAAMVTWPSTSPARRWRR